jgi:hypothetical protein
MRTEVTSQLLPASSFQPSEACFQTALGSWVRVLPFESSYSSYATSYKAVFLPLVQPLFVCLLVSAGLLTLFPDSDVRKEGEIKRKRKVIKKG